MGNLGPLELTLILVIVVLLFGAKRLPETAKSVGQSLKVFKKAVRDDEEEAAAKADPPEVNSKSSDPAPPPSRAEDPKRAEY